MDKVEKYSHHKKFGILSPEKPKFFEIDIYPVISSEFTNNRHPIDILKAVADGGAKIVQLREKNMSKKDVFSLAEEYKKICNEYGMFLIINDYIDIALSIEADGVHLGQDDLPLPAAKKIGKNLIIGVSTHSFDEAMEAQKLGASYINIGPIFSTSTKQTSYKPLGIETVKKIMPYLKIPFTVMGGIKEQHIETLRQNEIKRIAMVTEITMADKVKDKVISLRKRLCP